MPSRQYVNTPLILTVGAVSGVLLVVIGIGTEAWFQSEENREITAKWDAPSSVPVGSLLIEDTKMIPPQPLDVYRWTDPHHKALAIPIAEAMRLLVETQGKLPAAPTTNPAATAPATAPAASPATGPATPPKPASAPVVSDRSSQPATQPAALPATTPATEPSGTQK